MSKKRAGSRGKRTSAKSGGSTAKRKRSAAKLKGKAASKKLAAPPSQKTFDVRKKASPSSEGFLGKFGSKAGSAGVSGGRVSKYGGRVDRRLASRGRVTSAARGGDAKLVTRIPLSADWSAIDVGKTAKKRVDPTEPPTHRWDCIIVRMSKTRAPQSMKADFLMPVRDVLAEMLESKLVRSVSPVFAAPRMPMSLDSALDAVVRIDDDLPDALNGWMVVDLASENGADALIGELKESGRVEYAYTPPMRYLQSAGLWWHQQIRLPQARQLQKFSLATDVHVSVIDSGIDPDHSALKPQIEESIDFCTAEPSTTDKRGHGTHIAGLIAATATAQSTMFGVCRPRIHALRVFPKDPTKYAPSDYYRALRYAKKNKARLVNLSVAGVGADPLESQLIQSLLDDGRIVVAASGNEGHNGNPTLYPAAYPGVITVGATDASDKRAAFSCKGNHVALCAPGVEILSTKPQSYGTDTGTSSAAAQVTGTLAVMVAIAPNNTRQQLRDALVNSCVLPPGSTRPHPELAGGRLDVMNAIASL